MTYTKPQSGQPVGPFISDTRLWSDVVQMVNQWKAGGRGAADKGSNVITSVMLRGDKQRDAGTIIQLSDLIEGNAADIQARKFRPTFTTEDPIWHTAIDNIMVLGKSINDKVTGFYGRSRFAPVKITIVSTDHRYAMIDPAKPTELKSASAGIYRVMGYFPASNIAVVDTFEGYFNWRFELTEDWDDASVTVTGKLLNWDGTDFSTQDTTIEDPDGMMRDLASGDRGYCHHIGNKFIAYQAACEADEDAGPVFP